MLNQDALYLLMSVPFLNALAALGDGKKEGG